MLAGLLLNLVERGGKGAYGRKRRSQQSYIYNYSSWNNKTEEADVKISGFASTEFSPALPSIYKELEQVVADTKPTTKVFTYKSSGSVGVSGEAVTDHHDHRAFLLAKDEEFLLANERSSIINYDIANPETIKSFKYNTDAPKLGIEGSADVEHYDHFAHIKAMDEEYLVMDETSSYLTYPRFYKVGLDTETDNLKFIRIVEDTFLCLVDSKHHGQLSQLNEIVDFFDEDGNPRNIRDIEDDMMVLF